MGCQVHYDKIQLAALLIYTTLRQLTCIW